MIPENIFSLFLTQGTLDILLLLTKKEEEEDDDEKDDDDDDDEREGKEEEKPPSQLLEVKKCEVLKDVRFRGAISDFYCLKEQLIKEEKKTKRFSMEKRLFCDGTRRISTATVTISNSH